MTALLASWLPLSLAFIETTEVDRSAGRLATVMILFALTILSYALWTWLRARKPNRNTPPTSTGDATQAAEDDPFRDER